MKKKRTSSNTRGARLKAMWKRAEKSGKKRQLCRQRRLLRGMLNHAAAKAWVLRSPEGEIYECRNLSEWARRNKRLFVDWYPSAKTSQPERIASGLRHLVSWCVPEGTTYQGWSVVRHGPPDDAG